IVLPKTELATAAPDVVEAVAPAINIPEIGASAKLGRPNVFIPEIITSFNAEFEIIPASVPVPINNMATPVI
ncbi:hypothetical protein Q604_UNBC01371G0001, partial [human gut metagenome]